MADIKLEPMNFSKLNSLLDELRIDLVEARHSLQEQEKLLQEVKLFSRQPYESHKSNKSRLYDEQTINLLAQYGLERERSSAAKEALRSLANMFLLHSSSRQMFVDLDYEATLAEHMTACDVDEEFLYARMLLLCTYSTGMDFVDLTRHYGLARSIEKLLQAHADDTSMLGDTATPQSTAMSEVLRLVFNLQAFHPVLQKDFLPLLPIVGRILTNTTWPAPVLQPPAVSVINALLSLDLDSAMHDQSEESRVGFQEVVKHLAALLSRATKEHQEADLDQGAAPLVTLLRRIYKNADKSTRELMQQLILPSTGDRKVPLGQGDSPSARLLRLTTSALLPILRSNISSLLFELSDQDPEKFVQNIGYGYASGFLMSNNIPVPVDDETEVLDSNTNAVPTNPITGQTVESEGSQQEPVSEMTEEEKEREAERLFVLFERLKATGVVDVKNPVEQYREEQEKKDRGS